MKYEFYNAADVAFYDFPIIDFRILDEEYKILDSLGRLSGEYVKNIVDKMEQVRDGKIEGYTFGPDDSILVEAVGPSCKTVDYRNKCYITRAFDREFEIETPFEEIYNLMRDYRDEIIKWEEKTGMEKPGW